MVAITIYTHYDMVYQSEWKFTIERHSANHFLLSTIYSTPIQQQMYEDRYSYMDGIARYVYVFYTVVDNNGHPVEEAQEEAQEEIPDRPPVIVRQIDVQRIMAGIAEIQRRETASMNHIPYLVL
jgi:hypothetical protein